MLGTNAAQSVWQRLKSRSQAAGLATPVRNMPDVLQWATWLNPLRFAVDLVRRVYLEGAGLAQVAIDFLPFVLIASLTLPLAAWMFRNRLA